MSPDIRITGAGAGTGKTHRLCRIISDALADGTSCRPGGFIATTFTRKAAAELTERVRKSLLERGLDDAALRVEESLVGTVHSVCSRILERFAFEAGISPRLRVLDEKLEEVLLGGAVEECFSLDDMSAMERLSRRLGQTDTQTGKSKWKQQVRDVISAARSNKIDPAALGDMALRSSEELLAHLPDASAEDLDASLLGAIEAACAMIEAGDDETKTTATCVECIKDAAKSLRGGNLAWSEWCKIAKLGAGKKSQQDIEPVKQAASRVEEHPGLHADLKDYIARIFQLAGAALDAYQKRKKSRGMLDFTDLEVLTLDLLDRPHVRECLGGEYDLLVVDEFQDTSPIQLELFVRLAGLVKQTHWVGDTKQAIYGFRGCDPQLMREAEKMFRKEGETETLGESRRHRPELVDFFNGLFPEVFAKTHGIQPGDVTLRAHRKGHPELSPAIESWRLDSGRKLKDGSPAAPTAAECLDCVVRGIRQLMDGGILVCDKGLQTESRESTRHMRWRDIAVLCRTNDKATALASRLEANGIPTARRTQGLMSSPEAVLALACLRWLVDEHDSIAVAEILTLETGCGIESWLEDRIAWVADPPTGQWGLDGSLQSATLKRIQPLKDRLKLLSPSELLDGVLVHGDIAGIATQWNPEKASKRRANLEAMRGLAAEYESSCLSAGIPASHAGFLNRCDELATAGEDLGAIDENADAVQVMTWHGSKGLEWPVVICLDLADEPRPRLWNTPIAVSPANFDPVQPLADRRIRFWPYPFGAQVKDVPFSDRVLKSDAGLAAADSAANEQSRLHYVVMTRARDYLVFPSSGKPPWLPAGVTCTAFDPPTGNPPQDIAGGSQRRLRYLSPSEEEPVPSEATSPMWFPPPLTPTEYPAADLAPSSLPPLDGVTTGTPLVYGTPLRLPPGQSDTDVGNALHAILAAHLLDPENPDFPNRVPGILEAHCVRAEVDCIVAACSAFHSFLMDTFHPIDVLVEVPFTRRNAEGQRIKGFIDLVLITSEGAVLIDHKSYPGANAAERAITYSGQLAAYRETLQSHGLSVQSSWIHYCSQTSMLQVLP